MYVWHGPSQSSHASVCYTGLQIRTCVEIESVEFWISLSVVDSGQDSAQTLCL